MPRVLAALVLVPAARATEIKATMTGPVAHVEVRQTWHNPDGVDSAPVRALLSAMARAGPPR
jgi:hypothetical protein